MTKFTESLKVRLEDASIAQIGLGLPEGRQDDADGLSKQLAWQKLGSA